MKLKLVKESNGAPIGSIVEVDEVTFKSFIASGDGIEYTDEVKLVEQKDAIVQEAKTINVIKGKKNMSVENMIGKAFQAIYEGKAVTGLNETTAADGGNLIGTAISEVVGLAVDSSKVWSKCRKIVLPVNTNSVKVPVDTTEPWLALGKPVVDYPVEGGQKTATKLSFGAQTLTLGKTVFYIPVTEELLQDTGMLDGWIRQCAYGKLATTLDNSVLSGAASYSGVVGNATYTSVAVVSAVPTAAQLYDMTSRIYPTMTPEFYVGPADWAAIKAAFVGASNLNNQLIDPVNMKLVGFNVNVIPLLSQIVLADFSQYTVAVPRVNDILSVSEHIRFDYDEVCYRLVHRSAGAPTFARRTASDGTVMGAFVQSHI